MARGYGARLQTVDGRELLDFCGSWGPLILGHARAEVVAAITSAAAAGTSFGACTPGEVEFAELLCECVPSLEKVRLVSSGTEAVMTALRLARGATGRRKILKFDGCYHGHSDSLLVAAGSGLLTGGLASSAGVSQTTAEDTHVVPYNDLAAVQAIVDEHGADLAAIIVEPIAGNMGLVPPADGFLAGLRELANSCGALLIFDEVITGFRLAATTYGQLCGVTPDLTCLGKIIGGGLPIGAVGGRAGVMDHLAPLGRVYQAGTLSGNPVAVAAGLTTLKLLLAENPYPRIEALGATLAANFNAMAEAKGVCAHCVQVGGMFTVFFTDQPVTDLASAKACNTDAHAQFFHRMLDADIYLPPSQFEVAFVAAVHTEADIERFVEAASCLA
jgi:glutamate-1-semialdehyde 2,1-aminomutase